MTQAGAASAGEMGNLGGVSLNAQPMEAGGGSSIQARIGVLNGILPDRGIEVPEAR